MAKRVVVGESWSGVGGQNRLVAKLTVVGLALVFALVVLGAFVFQNVLRNHEGWKRRDAWRRQLDAETKELQKRAATDD